MEHGIYFIGTYEWEALGESALPFLLELLRNRCETVRLHAVISLGRIGKNSSVKYVLEGLMNDTVPVAGLAEARNPKNRPCCPGQHKSAHNIC
ncbi:MAG: HEAT repeat domain-containing protein [Acetivibrionales bacterium]